MAKFTYRMQNILDIKYKLESQAKTVYAMQNEKLNQLKLKLQTIYDDILVYEDKIRKINSDVLDIKELQWCTQAIEIKKNEEKKQKAEIIKAQEELEKARLRLKEVMIERKTQEKLKEKAFEEFKYELSQTEKKEVDELVSFKYNKSE